MYPRRSCSRPACYWPGSPGRYLRRPSYLWLGCSSPQAKNLRQRHCLPWPPLTEALALLASFTPPPHSEAKLELATLSNPPMTQADVSRARFAEPPLTEACSLVARFLKPPLSAMGRPQQRRRIKRTVFCRRRGCPTTKNTAHENLPANRNLPLSHCDPLSH